MPYISLGLTPLMLRAERAVYRKAQGDLGGMDAVIYSAMAAEAFPSDFAHMAAMIATERDKQITEIVAASQILTELEEQHAQTKTKYQILYYILARAPLPTGDMLWGDFLLLLRLRNELVHPKPENVDDMQRTREPRVRKLVDSLRAKKLTGRPPGSEPDDWSFMLEDNDRAARWALRTAKQMIQLVAKQVPSSDLRDSYLAPFIKPEYLESRLWGTQ